ncbi:BMP family ABC transporter substrate-binding protein [uncultured Treponema sp.]|uniref:BMP family lipoprotein n=1 Tax=uncultured Treponema sp. TaxID=162155 RepID=UPI0025F9D68B|nr:BMP family ABC transporter substrate-binding protein [uncultured Treponema sp.]
MKKFLVSMMVAALAVTSFVSCNKKKAEVEEKAPVKVAMVTDYGDITDQSFNQTTYEACKAFCTENGLELRYYKPSNDSTEARVASINAAIQDDHNVVVLPGFAFSEALVKTVDEYPEVTFIALDVSEFDVLSAAKLFGKPASWKLPSNAFCAVYKEELPGFMAGYAAVKEGYKHLGFLGGMAVPAVIRYGYGFVFGAEKAAVEMGIAKEVVVEYVYGGQFYGDQTITSAMDAWYQQRGVEIVFACGGGIWTSAAEAAAKVGGKVIGVDVDQSALINKYGDGMCVTSAMKSLAATVFATLRSAVAGSFEADFGGDITALGLVSDSNIEENYVGLPTNNWTMKKFTLADYKNLVADMFNRKITVSDDISNVPNVAVKLNVYSNIK